MLLRDFIVIEECWKGWIQLDKRYVSNYNTSGYLSGYEDKID